MAKDLLGAPEYFTARQNADGSFRYYWRASARIAKLLEGSPHKAVVALGKDLAAAERKCREITIGVEAYIRARGVRPPAAARGRTLAEAIADFRASPDYLERAHDTRRQYDWIFARILKWGGSSRIDQITFKVVSDAAVALKDQLRTREVFLGTLAYIVDREKMAGQVPGAVVFNPVRQLLDKIERPEPKGGWVWPHEAVDAMAASFDALGLCSIGTAIILNAVIGQRTADVLRLPRSAYRDGVLHLVQSKTGKYVQLPVGRVPKLRDRLEWQFGQEARQIVQELRPRTLLVCETTREPWKIDHFRHEFARGRAALGLAKDAEPGDVRKLEAAGVWPVGGFVIDCPPKRLWKQMEARPIGALTVRTDELVFGHLRHTAITRLHQAGCTDEQIQAISGHDHPSTAYKHYVASSVDTAAAAFAKLEAFGAQELPRITTRAQE